MYEYWIGKDVNYKGIWKDFDSGFPFYADKFVSMRVHVLRLTFRQPKYALPLFNHEAVFKTIKGYFHDLKELCLRKDEYMAAGPLFLYSVERGSGIWSFLGELRQLLLLGTTLADEKVVGEKLANMDRRLEFLKKHFGGAISSEDFKRFMQARTPKQLEKAVQRLIEQGIQSVEISEMPFDGDAEAVGQLIDLKALLVDADGARDDQGIG